MYYITNGLRLTTELLNYAILVEPDRQRLGQFVMHAVHALGGSAFQAIRHLHPTLAALRQSTADTDTQLDVSLELADTTLQLRWADQCHMINRLPAAPDPDSLEQLARRLRLESETADPSLLKLRNQEIAAELDRLTEQAAEQMQAMEKALDGKRLELEETMRQAETDSLTGLLNRGAFDERLAQSIRAAQGSDQAMCLILLDLDFFKQVNDSRGHQYGDRYLQKMADGMLACIRQQVDIACRIGGDEFAIICFCELPDAERIAQQVLEHMDSQVSIGIGRCRNDDTPESLVERTDSCLYRAKRQGRNQWATEQPTDCQAANG